METAPCVDLQALESDLRLATAYAARVGVLADPELLQSLDAVEQSRDADRMPDAHRLTLALNRVAQAILPMTLADLRCGRDPIEPRNQRRARGLQLGLSIFALLTMLMIGHSMLSMRVEQAGVKALERFQTIQPARKVTELRKVAQFENPLAKPNLLSDPYREKLAEWVAMYQTRELLDQQIYEARTASLFPWSKAVDGLWSWLGWSGFDAFSTTEAAPGATAGNDTKPASDEQDQQIELCARDASGALKLPAALAEWPAWVRNIKADLIDDLCFQNEVLQPITGGNASLILTSQSLGRAVDLPRIESRMALRSDWLLPFFFGMLGAIIFVMRNVANIRTPALQLSPLVMRIFLGGIAGIVIGWFSNSALPAFTSTSALSVPFALAFLTGYGIDALFGALDRMSRLATTPAPTKSA